MSNSHTHPPVKAIMGNTERHSFNFILSTVWAFLYNVIISSRSAGSSDRAMLSRHRGNANWFHISHDIFKASTCYIDSHFKQRYENPREMSNCGWTILYAVSCLLWSPAHETRYFLNATLSERHLRGIKLLACWSFLPYSVWITQLTD